MQHTDRQTRTDGQGSLGSSVDANAEYIYLIGSNMSLQVNFKFLAKICKKRFLMKKKVRIEKVLKFMLFYLLY